ncbi:MAG: hypothetical protein P8M63_00570 [Paracoccaceae bacterium]|nr:hypothetical protein [Paracoccaceae bacterium]
MPDRSGFDFPENYHEFELNIREHFRTSTRQKYNPLAKFINSLVHRGQRLRQMITPLLKLQLLSTNKLVDERSVPMIEDVEQPHLNGLFSTFIAQAGGGGVQLGHKPLLVPHCFIDVVKRVFVHAQPTIFLGTAVGRLGHNNPQRPCTYGVIMPFGVSRFSTGVLILDRLKPPEPECGTWWLLNQFPHFPH